AANSSAQDRDARPGATAPPALPAPNNSPASPSATVTGNGKPSRPWPDVWPTTSSSPSSPTPPSATVGRGSYRPSPVPPPTPSTTNSHRIYAAWTSGSTSTWTTTGHRTAPA